MNRATPINSAGIDGARRVPGLLLQPFGWAAEPIMRLALTEPRLLVHLTDLDTLRMHVMAFYLALRSDVPDDGTDAAFLASARSHDVVAKALARPPGRLLGLLRRLPGQAMSLVTYTQLATITSNKKLVNAMMNRSKIRGADIKRLTAVPSVLLTGRLLRALDGDMSKLASVVETTNWFAHRWRIDVADRFAAVRNLAELSWLMSDLLSALPPVPRLPPRIVGHAKLIETPQELARAARTGRNCLGSYAPQITLLKCSIYIWDDGDEPIYIEVKRKDRLGWFLSEMKVAKNQAPPDERRQLVDHAFDAAGIDADAVASNLKYLLEGEYSDLWDLE